MDRLTFEGDFCTIAMCRENPCPYDNSCTQREVWERLKAYEDTRLEPEVCAEYKKFEDECVSKGVPFKRVVELLEAEKDGRLVVLPCKVGKGAVPRPYPHKMQGLRPDPQRGVRLGGEVASLRDVQSAVGQAAGNKRSTPGAEAEGSRQHTHGGANEFGGVTNCESKNVGLPENRRHER